MQETKTRIKKKAKAKVAEVVFDLGEAFSVAESKDEDFDLDLDCAKFQGKKGQAGSRSKAL